MARCLPRCRKFCESGPVAPRTQHDRTAMVTATEMAGDRQGATDTRVIGLVSAAHFVSHIYGLVLPPLFAFIRGDYGLSYQELAVVLASFNLVSAALQTPTGF